MKIRIWWSKRIQAGIDGHCFYSFYLLLFFFQPSTPEKKVQTKTETPSSIISTGHTCFKTLKICITPIHYLLASNARLGQRTSSADVNTFWSLITVILTTVVSCIGDKLKRKFPQKKVSKNYIYTAHLTKQESSTPAQTKRLAYGWEEGMNKTLTLIRTFNNHKVTTGLHMVWKQEWMSN